MSTPLPLEGDGLIENLFYFLWCKDEFGGGPERVFIPSTILFRSTQPSAWYFSSLRTGKIKRKNRSNLTNPQIEHEFTKSKSPTDIVAYYIYLGNPNVPSQLSSSSASSPVPGFDDDPGTSVNTVIEYFTASMLREFLYNRQKMPNGILQKFVLPKGSTNTSIRVIWSPKVCLLERRVNSKNVHDQRYSAFERAVTFDGDEVSARTEPIRGAMLPGDVQQLCERVVEHVTKVSYHKYRIARMVLHLKNDSEDRLWLLWCSSMRLLDTSASGAPIKPLDIVGDAKAIPTPLKMKASDSFVTANDEDEKRCTSCGQVISDGRLMPVPYKAVLEHFMRFLRFLKWKVNDKDGLAIEWPPDQQLIDAAGGVGFGIMHFHEHAKRNSYIAGKTQHTRLDEKELLVPPVLKFLHPSLTAEELERHRYDPLFLHKQAYMCERCCLVYSDYMTTSLESNSIRQSAPAILRPTWHRTERSKMLDPLDPLDAALENNMMNGSVSCIEFSNSRRKEKPPASAWKPVSHFHHEQGETLPGLSVSDKVLSLNRFPSAPTLPALSMDNIPPTSTIKKQSSTLGKEEAYLQELSEGKVGLTGHPLQYMIETATALEHAQRRTEKSKKHQADVISRLAHSSNDASISKAVGSVSELVAQTDTSAMKRSIKNPYTAVQRLPETNNASTRHTGKRGIVKDKRQQTRKVNGKGRREDGLQSSDDNQDMNNGIHRLASSRGKKDFEKHQDFLFAALADAKQQLAQAESLSSIALAADPSVHPGVAEEEEESAIKTEGEPIEDKDSGAEESYHSATRSVQDAE